MRQFVNPVIIRQGKVSQLHRVPFDSQTYPESWLQRLLYEHPELLPLEELEPVFGGSIAIAREVRAGGGALDLLLANAAGHLTLVETKLWRNPEARRSVVAQIVDYAKSMAQWSYPDLVKAVKKATGSQTDDPLRALLAEDAGEFDETTFTDGVSRCLNHGRFLLLIVGDGIREDTEHMVEFLQQTPQLGFTLALLEMGLYREHLDQEDPLYVQPRVLARTREITRAIVEIKTTVEPTSIGVTVPAGDGHGDDRRGLTEKEFFTTLAGAAAPAVVDFARWVLDEAKEHNLEIAWGGSGPLLQYTEPGSGEFFTFGQLSKQGVLASTRWLFRRCRKLSLPDSIARDYLDEVAALIPGAKRRHFTSGSGETEWEQIAVNDSPAKGHPPLADLVGKGPRWFAAIDRAIEHIEKAMDEPARGR